MSYRGKIVGVLALALAVPLLGTAPAQSSRASSDNTIKVIQHNPDGLGPEPAMQAASDWGDVDALTFQELCQTQVATLRAAGYRVRWSLQRAANPSGTRCRKGNAIATTRTFDGTKTYRLLTRGKKDKKRIFTLLCANLTGTGVGGTTVCTSHFPLDYNSKKKAPTGRQNRIKVANKIRSIVNAKINAGRRVVLTGDFNDKPKSAPLDRFYRVKGNGRFWEGDQKCGSTKVCRSMPATTSNGGRKDYFFASSPGVDRLKGVSKLPVPQYDGAGHYVIRGSVKFGALR